MAYFYSEPFRTFSEYLLFPGLCLNLKDNPPKKQALGFPSEACFADA